MENGRTLEILHETIVSHIKADKGLESEYPGFSINITCLSAEDEELQDALIAYINSVQGLHRVLDQRIQGSD